MPNNSNNVYVDNVTKNLKENKIQFSGANSTGRKFSGKLGLAILIFGVFVSLVHIWFNSFGMMEILKKNSMHLSLMLAITFLTRPATSRSPQDKPSYVDWILFTLAIASGIYFNLAYFPYVERTLQPNTYDIIYGVAVIFLLIEGARRTVGAPLVLLSVAFLVYIYVGPYMPGLFSHQGYAIKAIINRLTMTAEGVLGIVLMISASYVFMFILFSSFLQFTSASKFFNDFSSALAGTTRGGPAKISIFASALTGTINGSAQANVVTTGAFTIPLMKSVGYSASFSASVEAVASTGGILMPPIMGAAAFIMSAFLGVPYHKIMIIGFTPAFLYYISLYFIVDLRAVKIGLRGLSKEELPKIKDVMKERGHMLIPLVIMITILLLGYSALRAAFVGIISILVFSSFRKNTRLTFNDFLNALYEGAYNGASVAVICGIVGFIVASTTMTGLGQIIGVKIIELSSGNLFLAAFFTMITAIILGMGLPGSACYIITASIAAPALIMLGVPKLNAHFFTFYYGIMSEIVPPVALASYTAAAIARVSSPTKVAITAFFLGSAGLLIPFLFIFNPVLLLHNFTWFNFIYTVVSTVLALYALAVAIIGCFKTSLTPINRFFFAVAAFFMIFPDLVSRAIGFGLFAILVFFGNRITAVQNKSKSEIAP